MLTCPKCKAELDLTYEMSLTLSRDPNEPPWRRVPLEELELSIRAHNCLHNMGCDTAGEVADKTDNELLRWPNLGRRSLREIREQIARVKAEQEPPRC
jgi:DNA-directed RNA polymerase subunit alpha